MEDKRPSVIFDYMAPEGELPLRDRLVKESAEALAKAGLSQQPLYSNLSALYKARGVRDTRVYPVWKTCSKYVKILPASFDDMVEVLGWETAKSMIPGVQPNWNRIEFTLDTLRKETEQSYYDEFWYHICDALENGEENRDHYSVYCLAYLFWNRGLPVDYYDKPVTMPKQAEPSKALVPIHRDRVPF